MHNAGAKTPPPPSVEGASPRLWLVVWVDDEVVHPVAAIRVVLKYIPSIMKECQSRLTGDVNVMMTLSDTVRHSEPNHQVILDDEAIRLVSVEVLNLVWGCSVFHVFTIHQYLYFVKYFCKYI
jgi:hypothetical protein